VSTAVAGGDLSLKITVDVRGEILELKNTINTMVDQLNAFAAEVARVAREVGTEGKLGGQAQVPGVAGTWKDLTDNVNVMAANLTEQVRGVVKVVTAVADGVLEQKLTVKSKGEIAALAETINNMIDTLATFADQVTSVAREVGVEGRLGGQANVPGASGTWKDLTGNVNRLAANLTTQVRAIAEVATAVTQGDMTRSIQVEARGEVAELKDNINTMIGNLRLTTERNTEQDWLKTNQARFTGMLQGQRDLTSVGNLILSELVPLVGAHQGLIYQMSIDDAAQLKLLASYGNPVSNGYPEWLEIGQGFIGQCAADKRRVLITNVPSDTVPIDSTLLTALPRSLVVLPVLFEGRIKAVIGLASLETFSPTHLAFLEQFTSSIGIVLNSIEATMQTESLLEQSQKLAIELQTGQKELQQTNEQLAQKAQQLAEQNAEVERKNQQIEQARRALEEKAAELALTSKYKSEFLANMSHELRTPLNSILVLGQQLGNNAEGNLTPKQVEFARTIHGAGSDLLTLITDILDLSKIESGTVTVEAEDISFATLLETAKRNFRHEAESRSLSFDVQAAAELAHSGIVTDSKRLLQVLKNLLSNAFKFTEHGGVSLRVSLARDGWSGDHPTLGKADSVVAFEVSDTGIGIPPEKQKLIFEAFQQADASTSRKYGGTGLGLAISRELASLLGGEIQLTSTPGAGSTFTLYLPLQYAGPVGGQRSSRSNTNGSPPPQVLRLPEVPVERVADDRLELENGDSTLLIVEDDANYARTLAGLAREAGFKVLVAMNGAEALELTRNFLPSAITLDMRLPDMPGWSVLSELKKNAATRSIPVQIISLHEDDQHRPRGAYGVLTKPSTTAGLGETLARLREYTIPRRKRLLIVEDDANEQLSLALLLGHESIDIVSATTGREALEALQAERFECVVLDLSLPDISGFEILERIRDDKTLGDPPVVVFTGKDLSAEEDERLQQLARGVVIKDARSPERLLDETALLLHLAADQLPAEKWQMIQRLHESDEDLHGKLVLIVDDDVRNIFALSSVLEGHGMRTISANTGADAIAKIESTPEVAIVLMDIMMPEMDGFQTMRVVRQNPAHRSLPILALTAKAMKADREKCLEAGASDYLAKPVDIEQLLSTLRVWLHR
jgi:signal transduction histidine kinase/CheY-like chemotaxis protein/HAMP domain-containing protein